MLATFAYDDRGRRTSLTRGNGTVTSYAYDNADRLTQLESPGERAIEVTPRISPA